MAEKPLSFDATLTECLRDGRVKQLLVEENRLLAEMPLSDLLGELGRRFTSFVLVAEHLGDEVGSVANNVWWWGAPSSRIGLLDLALIRVRTEIGVIETMRAREAYDDKDDEDEE